MKKLVRRGEHMNAARMLIRVCEHISKFPKDKVPILTLAVMECYRSGLKNKAFEYASMLMQPELRKNIHEKYKKKIESIVRKRRGAIEEPEEEVSPSPFDKMTSVPRTQLLCPKTKNDIPWCVASGYHVEFDDFCICPNSNFPAIFSLYTKWVEAEGTDPVLGKPSI